MIHLNYLKENTDFVIERLRIKNFEAGQYVEEILLLDKTRRSLQKQLDDNFAEQNKIAKEIGMLFKQGKSNEAQTLKDKTATLKTDAKSIEEALTATEVKLNDILVLLPNIPHASVPKGKSADDNEVVYIYGDINTDSHMLPHWDICEKMKLIDFETGCKITGSGFPVYTGKGAKLQRALINFFLDHAINAGYIEIQPPYMVNEESAYATGQLPDKEGQMYHVTKDNLYLIPTAEVPVTNIYRNMILKTADLPIKHCAYSACFRREAGSYGKDVRGLNRLH
ncbi:MAG: serine--tRNA ligase, partial [Bacteroidales bacterium]|nr:serine--tRNA ligase [Bacteroidales bacterium]